MKGVKLSINAAVTMTYDVIVVGLGAAGSAVAAECALRGLRVLGLERFSPVHARGSSHGKARQIRATYGHHAYIPLIRTAFERWHKLQQSTDERLLTITGALYVGQPQAANIAGVAASACAYDVAIEALDAHDLARRFPMVRMRADETALFEPGAGYIVPETAVRLALARAVDSGAELRFGMTVEQIFAGEPSRVSLRDGDTLASRNVVICSGPWLPKGLGGVTEGVRAARVVQAWFTPSHDAFGLGRLPCFNVERPELPGILYGFPDTGDGVKAAFHVAGAGVDADSCDRTITDDELDVLAAALDDALPGAAARIRTASTCMYTMTPDENFVIGRAETPGLIICGGFSGHGFKFMPVVGEIVADLIADGATPYDLALFSPRRLRQKGVHDKSV